VCVWGGGVSTGTGWEAIFVHLLTIPPNTHSTPQQKRTLDRLDVQHVRIRAQTESVLARWDDKLPVTNGKMGRGDMNKGNECYSPFPLYSLHSPSQLSSSSNTLQHASPIHEAVIIHDTRTQQKLPHSHSRSPTELTHEHIVVHLQPANTEPAAIINDIRGTVPANRHGQIRRLVDDVVFDGDGVDAGCGGGGGGHLEVAGEGATGDAVVEDDIAWCGVESGEWSGVEWRMESGEWMMMSIPIIFLLTYMIDYYCNQLHATAVTHAEKYTRYPFSINTRRIVATLHSNSSHTPHSTPNTPTIPRCASSSAPLVVSPTPKLLKMSVSRTDCDPATCTAGVVA